MRLTYTARGRLLENGETIEHGEQFTATKKRGEQLLADPTISVEPADGGFEQMTRDELNTLAAQAGITSPEALPNKAAVIEALTPPEPHEGSTHPEQEVTE